jgi:WhiB family redox-sensing transcriptional regulator
MKSNRTWRAEAACIDAPQYLFFPGSEASRPGGSNLSDEDVKAARGYCQTCPVQPQCLQFALETKQDWGIWGGATVAERRKLLRERTMRRAG